MIPQPSMQRCSAGRSLSTATSWTSRSTLRSAKTPTPPSAVTSAPWASVATRRGGISRRRSARTQRAGCARTSSTCRTPSSPRRRRAARPGPCRPPRRPPRRRPTAECPLMNGGSANVKPPIASASVMQNDAASMRTCTSRAPGARSSTSSTVSGSCSARTSAALTPRTSTPSRYWPICRVTTSPNRLAKCPWPIDEVAVDALDALALAHGARPGGADDVLLHRVPRHDHPSRAMQFRSMSASPRVLHALLDRAPACSICCSPRAAAPPPPSRSCQRRAEPALVVGVVARATNGGSGVASRAARARTRPGRRAPAPTITAASSIGTRTMVGPRTWGCRAARRRASAGAHVDSTMIWSSSTKCAGTRPRSKRSVCEPGPSARADHPRRPRPSPIRCGARGTGAGGGRAVVAAGMSAWPM